jgi:hypothetical protein
MLFRIDVEKKLDLQKLYRHPFKNRKMLICFIFGHRYTPDGEPFYTMSTGIPMQGMKCKRCRKYAYNALVNLSDEE